MTHLSLNSGSRILMSHWYPADTVWWLASAFCSLSLTEFILDNNEQNKNEEQGKPNREVKSVTPLCVFEVATDMGNRR